MLVEPDIDLGLDFCFFALIMNIFDWIERLDDLSRGTDRPMATARNVGIDMENFFILLAREMDCFEDDMPLREEV